MLQFPPIPSWEGLHPLIVHFPIALLLVAPLFVLLGAILSPPRGRPFLVAALVLMVLGTAGTMVAVSTGSAAEERAEAAGPAVEPVLERHEDLAETTRTVFLVLTAVFAALVVAPRLRRRELPRPIGLALLAVFLVAYGAGGVLLANTAHQGGRLVHELGVKAAMAPGVGAAAPAEAATEAGGEGTAAGEGRRGRGRGGNDD